MNRVLVTGANGFIGRHLIISLLDHGYEVVAGVRKESLVNAIENLPISISRLDYLDKAQLHQAIKEIQPDIIVHNAGVTVAMSREDYFKGNTESTANLVEVCKSFTIRKFIFVSSLTARGPGSSNKDLPISPYGESKLDAENHVKSSGIPFTIVRPTGVYGPGDKAFPALFVWARRGLIFQLGKANRKMTFVHAADLAKIVCTCVEKFNQETKYGWDGENYTQLDFIDAFKHAIKRRSLVIPVPIWVYRVIMTSLDFFIRRIFRQFWEYPPWKVAEFMADDWSIKENESVMKSDYSLNSGFLDAYEHWKQTIE